MRTARNPAPPGEPRARARAGSGTAGPGLGRPQRRLAGHAVRAAAGQADRVASGPLDDEAAARLSAQLLTLDAEGEGPVRLELQNFRSDLPAALTVMGILDVLRVRCTAA